MGMSSVFERSYRDDKEDSKEHGDEAADGQEELKRRDKISSKWIATQTENSKEGFWLTRKSPVFPGKKVCEMVEKRKAERPNPARTTPVAVALVLSGKLCGKGSEERIRLRPSSSRFSKVRFAYLRH